MYVYVIYHDEESGLSMSKFDDAGQACTFMEEKLESGKGYELADFQVINGQPFGVKEVIKRKIYLTNAS